MPEVKLRSGNYMFPANVEYDEGKINISFGFNAKLKDEVKAMAGARWLGFDGGPKIWQVDDNEHNRFQLAYLQGQKVFAPYNRPLIDHKPERELFLHQVDMVCHALTRHYCIFACEMGTGKTLAAIEVMEASNAKEWWFVGPKSALTSVQLEFWKWKCKVQPKLLTYQALVREIKNWSKGMPSPQAVIFDESSKLKTPTSQQSQAAYQLAKGVREDWGHLGFVLLMSGSPAPKAPTDWWNQCEVARPGFLREGTFHKFQARLAILQAQEGTDGVRYNKIIGWKDADGKCSMCGKMESDYVHSDEARELDTGHSFFPCENELTLLHKRMEGLVLVKFKKDCLDLPEKQYRTIKVKPTLDMMNAARLLKATAPRAAEVLLRLRELSDGFQYRTTKDGTLVCPRCKGQRKTPADETHCHACAGSSEITKWKEETVQLDTPKDNALLDLLEEHEDEGRLVVFGSFTATIDRIVSLAARSGWATVVVDGRGWNGTVPGDSLAKLKAFQELKDQYPKICFIGHPGSAGMGLTLTASPSIVYYSNTFNAEERIQSEDRIHRPGCRGANIIDLICLPTDQLVLDNLKAKRNMQSMTLGEIIKSLEDEGDPG